MTTTHRILKAIRGFFDEEGWSYSQLEDLPILRVGYDGKNGHWNCFARIRELDEQCVFYAVCPLTIPEKKRLAIAEFLTRANYNIIIGNFEMDLDDGEVRYKASLDAESSELTSAMIKNAVYASVLMMDKYLPGILAILGGNVAPKQAIDEIEAEDREDDLSKS